MYRQIFFVFDQLGVTRVTPGERTIDDPVKQFSAAVIPEDRVKERNVILGKLRQFRKGGEILIGYPDDILVFTAAEFARD